MIKDRLGYIWITSDKGIIKYNGYSFKVFTTDDGLPTNDIWKSYEDNMGRIWLLNNSFELGYIKDDLYHPLKISDGSKSLLPYGVGSMGPITIVLTTRGEERFLSILINGHYLTIPIPTSAFPFSKKIGYMSFINEKYLWAYTRNHQTIRFNIQEPITMSKFYNINSELHTIDAEVTIGDSTRLYLFKYKGSRIKAINVNTLRLEIFDLPVKRTGGIITAYMTSNILDVVTEKSLFQIVNGHLIERKIQRPPTSSQISFLKLFQDTWYCTRGDGIWTRPRFITLGEVASPNKPLNNYSLAGTTDHAAYWWNAQNNSIIKTWDTSVVYLPLNLKEKGLLRSVTNVNDTPVFLFNTGIYKFKKNTHQLYNLFKEKALIMDGIQASTYKNVKSVDSIANFYFKNIRKINYLNDSTLLILNHSTVELLIERHSTLEKKQLLLERATGFLKIKGLPQQCIYNRRNIFLFNESFTKKLHIDYNNLLALGINGLLKIEQAENGDIYLLSENGLLCFKKGHFFKIQTNLNLNSADLFISKNRLILTGVFGVAVSGLSKNSIRDFRILINYKKKLYRNIISAYADKSGKVYLSTESKCYTISLDSLERDLRLISAKTKSVNFHLLNRNYQNLKETDTFLISENGERLTMDPIDYLGVDGRQLFFRLNDGKWQKAVNNEFPVRDLSPGEFYRFQYYLQDDFWKSKTHTLYVFQMPKWYQRHEWQFAFALAGLLFFAGSILLASSTTRRLVAKTNEKRRLQTELELRAIHSQINPHFIFNTLSTALYFISKEKTRDAYDHVNKFSKLLRNYLKSSRERFIILADEIEILKQYIDLQMARFSKTFHYEIYVAPDILTKHILLPSMLLQPLVENAINHGLFNKGDGGWLKVQFYKGVKETELICIIDDNGIGRAKAKELNRRYKKEKSSFGTLLTKELIDIFKRYEQMDIELEYIDKSEPETGTTVRLTIRNVKITRFA